MKLEAIPLSNLASVNSGGGAPQDPNAFTTTGLPFVRAGSLPKLLAGEDEGSLERLEPEVAEKHGLSLFPAGTVLFAKSGMSATKGHVYRLKTPAYVVNHLAALIPHVHEDSAFLVRVLQRFSPTTLIKDAAYPSIRLGDIENMKVLAPPDSNGRRRIAEILDKADALRAKRRAALTQLDTLTRSIFLDMFGNPATNPKGWPIRTFDETIRDETSQAEKLQRSDYLPDGRYPVVDQGQSVIAGYCDDDQYLCPSDLPVVVFGDHTRAVKLVRHPFVVGADGAKVLAPQPGVDAAFLSYLMRELPIPDLGYSRHMREVKRLAFPVPPIDRQKEFAQRVAGVELHRAVHDRSRLELDALFASVLHRVFRGEL